MVLAHDTDWLRIITSDMRGRSQIDLPLHGPGALAHDGDGEEDDSDGDDHDDNDDDEDG